MEREVHVAGGLIATVLFLTANAQALDCRLGKGFTFKNKLFAPCEITGHSSAGIKKTYQARCEGMPEFQHLEFESEAKEIQLLDSPSRYEIAKCETERGIVEGMVNAYDGKVHALENPPCYLTQWKGQMMAVAKGTRVRCTFEMKKPKPEEFVKKTGKSPLYQCEKGYFIVMPKNAAAEIYRPKKDGWESVCLAPTKVGEAPENIDWKNPPDYYSP